MSVAWPWNNVEAKVIVTSQPFDSATVLGQYLGHECPSYRNRNCATAHRARIIVARVSAASLPATE